jgi:hypothetical protein
MAQAKIKRTTSGKEPIGRKPPSRVPAQIVETKIAGHILVKAEHVKAGCYALAAEGSCMAPEICDGDFVVVSPNVAPEVGKIAGIFFKDRRQPKIKRLLSMPHVGHFKNEPCPGDEVVPVLLVAQDNPPKRFAIPGYDIEAVHAVVAVVRSRDANMSTETIG